MSVVFSALFVLSASASAQVANPKARQELHAEREQVYAYLADVDHLPSYMSERCVSQWQGAEAVWHFGLLHPRLSSVIDKTYAPATVDILNDGARAFTLRFSLDKIEDRTRVQLEAYLSSPPWPFVHYYERRVRPQIVQCLEESLTRLGEQLNLESP